MHRSFGKALGRRTLLVVAVALPACLDGGSSARFIGPEGADAGTGPQIVFDVFADSVPDIPFPNDIATRVDFASPTKIRVNASLVAPTVLEEDVRVNLDNLDGWGLFSPMTVQFTKTLDIQNVLDRHATADPSDDVLYVVDIDPRSRHFGEMTPVDLGRGNYPTRIDAPRRDQYFRADPLGFTTSIVFPTYAEDRNGNGVLDPGEDVDFDGELGAPNILRDRATGEPCTAATEDEPACDPNLRLIEFYELATDTLIIRPLVPLQQETRYAVVLTKRLVGYDGAPVRSPFSRIHHARQADALAPLAGVLAARAGEWGGLGIEDVAFAWTFTTQSVTRDLEAISRGISGEGPFAWLREEVPAEIDALTDFGNADELGGGAPFIVLQDAFKDIFGLFSIIQFIGFSIFDFNELLATLAAFNDSYNYVDYVVAGSFRTPDFLATPDEIWRVDPATGHAEVGEDRATFVMTIPRPIPGVCEPPFRTMFYGHGYSVSKLEMLGFGGFYARHCLAAIGMDAVGHGPELGMDQLQKDPDQVIPGPGTLDEKILITIADLVGGLFGLTGEEVLANPLLGPFIEALVDGGVQLLAELMYPMLPADAGITLDELKALPLTEMLRVATDTPFFEGILGSGRGEDLDGDGFVDSGEKFWTANIFRTRDVVRQGVVDHIQMIEVMQGFDGVRLWPFDTNGDGIANDLAGDFNGDGVVDIGGPDANYYSMGQSLGAFFSAILPAVDAAVPAGAPVSTGSGLADISIRTIQGGVVEAVFLEIMGPLLVGGPAELLDPPEGTASGQSALAYRLTTPGDVYGAVPEPLEAGRRYVVWDVGVGNNERVFPLAMLDALDEGDRIEVRNLRNGEESRAVAGPEGVFRIPIPSDVGDPIAISIRDGATGAEIFSEVTPALTKGLGHKRGSKDLRRLFGIAQMALEPGDPGSYARHVFREPLAGFPPSNVLSVSTIGDMNVPVSTGIAYARALGTLDFTTPDPDYAGRTENEALIDAGVIEGLEHTGRYTVREGGVDVPVLFDPADFDDGTDGLGAPGFPDFGQPPLRPRVLSKPLGAPDSEAVGMSGMSLPYLAREGEHGFLFSSPFKAFNIDNFMINQIAWYFVTGGREIRDDRCLHDDSCAFLFTRAPE